MGVGLEVAACYYGSKGVGGGIVLPRVARRDWEYISYREVFESGP